MAHPGPTVERARTTGSGGPPAIEFLGADCGYGKTVVLSQTTLEVGSGGFVGAVGPSGSGKTTLVRALAGRCRVLRGEVRVFGEKVQPGRPSREVGYVPQVDTIDTSFPITVEQVTLQGLSGGSRAWPDSRERSAVGEILERLRIAHLARRPIAEISGGELQRTFISRALIRRPALLLLDEPTSGVDLKTRHDVLHLLRDLNSAGVTVLLTTHDLNFVAAHLPRLVCLAGRVVADGTPGEVFREDILRATYGADVRVIRDGDMVFAVDPTHLLTGHRGHNHHAPTAVSPEET